MQTVENRRPILTYRRDSNYISIAPEVLECLGGDLTIRKRILIDDVSHGYDIRQIRESLLPRNRLPNAGLIELLAHQAAQRGFRLHEIAETPISTLPDPVFRSHAIWPQLADFVQRHPRGLVRIPNSVDVANLIAELALAFPSSRIMLFGRINNLQPVYRQLLKLVPQEMRKEKQLAFVHGNRSLRLVADDDVPRVICCTPTAASDLDSEKCDIVVMYDAWECMHELMQWPLIQMDARFRLFGILRGDVNPKPYEQAGLNQVFGFQQLDLMSNGRSKREVHFAWVRHAGQAPAGSVTTTPAVGSRKARESVNPMAAYVNNHHRNELVSSLARTLRVGGPIDDAQFRDVRRWLHDRDSQPLSVTVVVDRLDHAIQLGKKLSDWPIIADPKSSNLHNIAKSIKRRINFRPQQWLPCQIVMTDVARTFYGSQSDVVIWAAGGIALDIPASWKFSRSDSERPLLIVDLLDDFAQATRAWSFRRRDFLAASDVFRVGTPTVVGRIERFLRAEGGQE